MVLEALQELRAISELAWQFDLHPDRIATGKNDLLAGAPSLFESVVDHEREALKQDELFQQIGRLHVENECITKKVLR